MGEETDVSGRIPGNSQGGNPQDPESLLPSPNIGDSLLDDWTLHLNQVQPPSLSLTPANTATNQQPYHNNFSNPDSLQTSRVFRPTQLSTSDTIRQPSLKFPLSGGLRNDLSGDIDSKATKDPMANDTPLGPRLLAQSVPRPFSRSDSNGVMERSSPRTRRTSNPNPSKTKGHHSRRHSRTHSEVLRDDTNGARQAAYPTSHRISLPLTPKGVTGFNQVASPPTSRSTSLPRLKPTASDRRAAAGALPEPSSIRPVPLPSSLKHPQRASPHISEDQIWHAIGKRKDRVDHDNTGGPAEVVDAALPRSILKSTTSTLGSANG
ncbi:uncharacterized protein EI90DRAFT_3015431 [Cantharellus anzutake]|uniref:uncharacterized protein n=1 Tax=Cantharellus anzutake TaxID=1750568 RepID=UPI001905B271|nr:uncharacterized protein EI90DRAFT_3015431 [Cantharellus anzutake]KAF8333573.1 hypothetical protein EI90DRAFT_3015431 [Cantharellus anzutake]